MRTGSRGAKNNVLKSSQGGGCDHFEPELK